VIARSGRSPTVPLAATEDLPATMLSLKSATMPRWFEQVSSHLDLLLIDHAHCEKKAAGTALNLIFAYVDKPEICRELSAIVNEELEHFQMVLDLLEQRGIRFRRLPPSSYGRKLNELISKQEPEKAIDRLLVAGLIEARSCERFGLLRTQLPDPALAVFYDNLFESEARHHSTYVRLAKLFGSDELVDQRLDALSAAEAEIIAIGDSEPRMHS
jgi:tRNA-(ms[2]io[6]A)-hydroxylase